MAGGQRPAACVKCTRQTVYAITATLRNLAINTLRDAGRGNIAAGLRHASYETFTRPLDLLGIA